MRWPTLEAHMTESLTKKLVTELIVKILKVEKAFAHQLAGARNDRRAELKDVINKFVSEKLEK
jgi:hypothetical protein